MSFSVHKTETAPEEAKPLLKDVEENYGFVPNLFGIMAEAPATLKAYLQLHELFTEETSFNPVEQQVVLMTVSRENNCEYCMAAHSAGARSDDINDDVIESLRAGEALEDDKLEALRQYTLSCFHNGGHPAEDVKKTFINEGYGPQQALEIMLGIAMKTLSNYTNHLAHTPLDGQLKEESWDVREKAA